MARLKEYNGYYCESEYEYAFIRFLETEGWIYSSGNNISRVTKRDVLIADDFKKFIVDTNPDLTEDEVTQILIMFDLSEAKVTLLPCIRFMAGWLMAFSLHLKMVLQG